MRDWKLLLVAVVVAVGIVGAIDYLSDGGLAFQRITPLEPGQPQGMFGMMPGHGPHTTMPLPPPVGAPDAKVRLQAFVASGNPCHEATIATLRAAAEALPNRIRLEFVDTYSNEGQQAAAAAGIHCMSGLLINSKRNLEYQDKDGKMHGVEFSGPLSMLSADVLPLVLAYELRSQYGDAVSQSEIDTLTAAVKKAMSTSGPSGAAHGPGA
jgi:hypothetical protein